MTTPLLELRQITVSFDGFLALRDLNLSLQSGELRAVIGPNGAGKTTFLDVITGKTKPTEGQVVFKGRSLVGTREHRIARLGIGQQVSKRRGCLKSSAFKRTWLWQSVARSSHWVCCWAGSRLSSVIRCST